MNSLTFIISFTLLMISCRNNNENPVKLNHEIITNKINNNSFVDIVSDSIDIEIKFWNGTSARLHRLTIDKNSFNLYCDDSNSKFEIQNEVAQKELINFIRRFFIDNSDKIILNKQKRERIEVSSPSSIEVKVENKRKIIIDETIQMNYENFEVVYHPEFIKFYELIKQLTNSCENKRRG